MVEEFKQEGKWTIRVGDRVKVAGGIPEHCAKYYKKPLSGWTGELLELSVGRDDRIIAMVTSGPNEAGVRFVRADRLTKTNRG